MSKLAFITLEYTKPQLKPHAYINGIQKTSGLNLKLTKATERALNFRYGSANEVVPTIVSFKNNRKAPENKVLNKRESRDLTYR